MPEYTEIFPVHGSPELRKEPKYGVLDLVAL